MNNIRFVTIRKSAMSVRLTVFIICTLFIVLNGAAESLSFPAGDPFIYQHEGDQPSLRQIVTGIISYPQKYTSNGVDQSVKLLSSVSPNGKPISQDETRQKASNAYKFIINVCKNIQNNDLLSAITTFVTCLILGGILGYFLSKKDDQTPEQIELWRRQQTEQYELKIINDLKYQKRFLKRFGPEALEEILAKNMAKPAGFDQPQTLERENHA